MKKIVGHDSRDDGVGYVLFVDTVLCQQLCQPDPKIICCTVTRTRAPF